MSLPDISDFDGPSTDLRQNPAHTTNRLSWAAETFFGGINWLWSHIALRGGWTIFGGVQSSSWSWNQILKANLSSWDSGQNSSGILTQILLKSRRNTLNIVTHHVVWCISIFLWYVDLLEFLLCFIFTWVPISQLSSQLHQNFEVGAHKSKVKMHTNPKSKWAQIRLTENV